MEPHWEIKHNWWVGDFQFEKDQKEEVARLLMKHPHDEMGECFRSMIKQIDKRISKLNREYKKIYGRFFSMRRLNGY